MTLFEPPPPALGLLVARSEKAAVWLEAATADPTGVEFAIEVRWRPEQRDTAMLGAPWHYRPTEAGELPDELFRAGFEFADGSKVTSLGNGIGVPARDEPRKAPVLIPRGGGGESWSQGLWLWPLPPAGPLTFVCEWPALDIPLSRAAIDSARLREAAGRSKKLWDDNRPPHEPGGGPRPAPAPHAPR